MNFDLEKRTGFWKASDGGEESDFRHTDHGNCPLRTSGRVVGKLGKIDRCSRFRRRGGHGEWKSVELVLTAFEMSQADPYQIGNSIKLFKDRRLDHRLP